MSQHSVPNNLDRFTKAKLLIIEDDEPLRTQMRWALADEYDVLVAEDREAALEIVKRDRPALITLDLGLPPDPHGVEEGFEAHDGIIDTHPGAKVIVITGREQRENGRTAVAKGAYDFFNKPVDLTELKSVLRRALHIYRLASEYPELQGCLPATMFEGMIGTSSQMQEVFTAIRKVATTDAPVLILGESGSGKELAARAIHLRSARRDSPFVAINCGAIPDSLLESELFGHEKGAFTGAHTQRRGRLEMAQGGTLFLDEIGDLSPLLQVKLLRFLQEHRMVRVGGRDEIVVDARVIAASNKNLKLAITESQFREDLYFRLAVVTISMPPLRQREGDISLVAGAFLQKFALELKKTIRGFTPAALRLLQSHSWPGNVRELENRVRRAVIMTEGPKVTPLDLELLYPESNDQNMSLKEAREAVERNLILRALIRH
jgi:two-component system NtrC family response regulator